MSTLLQDLRYAIRMLLKNPGFTLVAVFTLALGIGANTAIFSVVNGLLLHPNGIPHPERLAAIRVRYEKLNLKSIVISAPDYTFVRDNQQTFAAAALETETASTYAAGSWPLRLRGAKVSSQWFDVFEAKPLLGRVFTPEEDQPNADREVVLAYNTWKTIFGGDSGIVGRSVQLNQRPYKIIGVMGAAFQWPSQTDLWAPLGLAPDAFVLDNIFNETCVAVGRLPPNVKFSSAAAFLNVASQEVIDDPRTKGYPKASGWSMFAVPFTEFVYGDVRTPLLILLGAVSFVLLIACSNVAGLLLARASARAKEFSIRTALGGSPCRLARQMLTESVVLALVGMAIGLTVASQAIRALLWLAAETLASGLDIHLDLYVLLFTALLAGASAIIFGAAPAWQIAFTDLQQNLKQGRGTGDGSRGRHRFRSALVVVELALALVLLASAGVFVKSLSKLKDVDVGIRPHGLMTAALALPERQYDTPAKQIAFLTSTVERLSNSPGVESAAAAVPLPFSGFGGSASFNIEGRVSPPARRSRTARRHSRHQPALFRNHGHSADPRARVYRTGPPRRSARRDCRRESCARVLAQSGRARKTHSQRKQFSLENHSRHRRARPPLASCGRRGVRGRGRGLRQGRLLLSLVPGKFLRHVPYRAHKRRPSDVGRSGARGSARGRPRPAGVRPKDHGSAHPDLHGTAPFSGGAAQRLCRHGPYPGRSGIV